MEFQQFGKWLIAIGVVIALMGIVLSIFGRLPFFGRLPGDIAIKRDHFSFYFPIVTCLVISVVLSVILNFFGRR